MVNKFSKINTEKQIQALNTLLIVVDFHSLFEEFSFFKEMKCKVFLTSYVDLHMKKLLQKLETILDANAIEQNSDICSQQICLKKL